MLCREAVLLRQSKSLEEAEAELRRQLTSETSHHIVQVRKPDESLMLCKCCIARMTPLATSHLMETLERSPAPCPQRVMSLTAFQCTAAALLAHATAYSTCQPCAHSCDAWP